MSSQAEAKIQDYRVSQAERLDSLWQGLHGLPFAEGSRKNIAPVLYSYSTASEINLHSHYARVAIMNELAVNLQIIFDISDL